MNNKNQIVKKIGKILSFVLIAAVVFCSAACKPREFSTEHTAYYVIYSGITSSNGRIEGIDVNGNLTSIYNIKAVNVGTSAVVGEEFVAGGHRANNHIIMREDGSYDEFYLLDNPNYSGVWCITLDTEKSGNIVAVMNGNVDLEKNAYLNLLVIQDREHDVKLRREIDITPRTLVIDGDDLYMSGGFSQFDVTPSYIGASVARYNMISGEYEENHFLYDTDKVMAADYMEMAKHGNYLYCVLYESLEDREVGVRQREIDVIDCETLEIVDTLIFDGEVSGICFAGDDLYIVIADKLCKYYIKSGAIEEIYTLPEDTEIDSLHAKNGHIYYSAIYIPAKKDGGMKNVGYIIDFDTSDKSVTETPLITDAKNPESVVFFPLTPLI